ncbi:M14 family zinc carboxypeptidase [Aquabacterium sp.]|uniref:M14 family zinc carboxypeptidase n=1 Tax=Aquabacterium sp. TaxID=1872578 RepID=UPI002CBB0C9C|nr:M14 family zinc carboxypeptidase [Aquabacterium sp.]HSW05547.1 M14 family zinc carboxypeptidase [Aquabacterium sp.]
MKTRQANLTPLAATLSALALALPALPGLAAADPAKDELQSPSEVRALEKRRVNFYKAWFPDLATARKAAVSFHNQLIEADYGSGHLLMELQGEDIAALQRFGFRIEPAPEVRQRHDAMLDAIEAATAQRRRSDPQAADAGVQAIPGFACYETVEETYAAAQAMATSQPNLAQWIDVGNSWQKTQRPRQGYDLFVLKLTNRSIAGDKPRLFINAAIHAREYATAPLTLAFARWLVDGYGTNADATWILDHHEVHLLLQTNPDGRKKAEAGAMWRKNINNTYCGRLSNSRGADLNRNFAFSWNATNGQGSSGNECSETYRGPSAASEPETQAMQAYERSLWPDRRGPALTDAAPADTSGIHLDIHSYAQLVLWPWGETAATAPNGPAMQTLGRRFAYFNGYEPMQSIGLYPTDGTTDGTSYGELGVASFTFEIGTSFFESCSSYSSSTLPNNLPALIYAAKVVRTPYLTPGGPDITTLSLAGNASGSGVSAGTLVGLSAAATDTRFNQSNGAEPVQAIAAAEAYIDVPPWKAGAVALPLQAADGAFNSSTEALGGSLATQGLTPGKHIVYVRASDASGQFGPITAVFLNIL